MPRHRPPSRSASTGSIGSASGDRETPRSASGGGRRGMGRRSSSSRARPPVALDVERELQRSEARMTVALELEEDCALSEAVQEFQGGGGGVGGGVCVPLLECGVRDWRGLVALQRLVARQQRPVAGVTGVEYGTEELLAAEVKVQRDSRQRDATHLALLFAREAEDRLWRFVNGFRLQLQSAGIAARPLLPAMQRVFVRLTEDAPEKKQSAVNWSGRLGWRALVVSTAEQDAQPPVVTQRALLTVPRGSSALKYPDLKPLVASWLEENRDPRVPVVVILRGIPGSGKSSIGRELLAVCSQLQADCAVCSADLYFETPRGYSFDAKALGRAHDSCKEAFSRAILSALKRSDTAAKTQRVIVVDNTNTQRWEYAEYEETAAKYGCQVHKLEMNCPDAATALRVGQRNSHGVPPSKVVSMFLRWEPDVDARSFTPQFDDALLTANPVTDNAVNGKVVYVGLFFDSSTRAKLLEAVPPMHRNVVADHVTVFFKPDELFMRTVDVGSVVKLRCVEIVQDVKGQAVRVELEENSPGIGIRNKIPHITVSTANGVSSAYSNELLASSTASRVAVAINPVLELPATLGFAMMVQNQRVITTRSAFAFSDDRGCVASSLERERRVADGEAFVVTLQVVCLDKDELEADGQSTASAERSSGIRDGCLQFDKLSHHLTGDCTAYRVLVLSSATTASTAELLGLVNHQLKSSGSGVTFDEVIRSSSSIVAEELTRLLKRDAFQEVNELVVLTSSPPQELALDTVVGASVRATVIGIRAPPSSVHASQPQQFEGQPVKVAPALDALGMAEQEYTHHQVLRACRTLTEASKVAFGQSAGVAQRMDSTVLGLSADVIDLGLVLKQHAWPSMSELERLVSSLTAELQRTGVHYVASSDPRRFYMSLCSARPLYQVRLLLEDAGDVETPGESQVKLCNDLRALASSVCPDRAMYGALVALVRGFLRSSPRLNSVQASPVISLAVEQLVIAFLQSTSCTLDVSDVKSGKILLDMLRLLRFVASWSDADWMEHLVPVSRVFGRQQESVSIQTLRQALEDRARALDGVDFDALAASPAAALELLKLVGVLSACADPHHSGSKSSAGIRAYATVQDRVAPGAAKMTAIALADELCDMANKTSVNPPRELFECFPSCVSSRIDVVAGSMELLHRVQDAVGRAASEGANPLLEARALVFHDAKTDREL